AHFTDPLMNGDHIDVDIHLSDGVAAKKAATAPAAPTAEPTPAPAEPEPEETLATPEQPKTEETGGKDGLLADYLALVEKEKAAAQKS
ncbi:MAG: hypothetical protein J6N22_09750, partial [Schwartzia sp.]|nr:hypothetical protein [Schwartzia sp. (in: firmicutes)]